MTLALRALTQHVALHQRADLAVDRDAALLATLALHTHPPQRDVDAAAASARTSALRSPENSISSAIARSRTL